MPRRHLPVFDENPPVLKGSMQRGYQVEDRVFVRTKSRMSILPEVILMRPIVKELVEGLVSAARWEVHGGRLCIMYPRIQKGQLDAEVSRVRQALMGRREAAPPDWRVGPDWTESELFSTTTKMGCKSFSLPAGPPGHGGSCPASHREFMYSERRHAGEETFICNGCYALKNNYILPSVSISQLVRFEVVRRELKRKGLTDLFIEAMRLSVKATKKTWDETPKRERHLRAAPDYFRLHDSGDFFSEDYWKAWEKTIRSFPDVRFWAPSRMWSLPKARAWFSDIPGNLALRPSALHFGEEPPPVPGWFAGSSSAKSTPKGYWSCPAYEDRDKLGGREGKEGTCGLAHGPYSPARKGSRRDHLPLDQGGEGCRVCWNEPLGVYYEEH